MERTAMANVDNFIQVAPQVAARQTLKSSPRKTAQGSQLAIYFESLSMNSCQGRFLSSFQLLMRSA